MPSELHVSDLAAGPDFFYATRDDQAPLFLGVEAISNGKLTKVNLNDYLGQWVLLFFYPSDFTFV